MLDLLSLLFDCNSGYIKIYIVCNSDSSNGSPNSLNPEQLGMEDITVHHRSRRSFSSDTTEYRLKSPTVEWRKMVGSTSIGASFGVTMANLMDLKIGNLRD